MIRYKTNAEKCREANANRYPYKPRYTKARAAKAQSKMLDDMFGGSHKFIGSLR